MYLSERINRRLDKVPEFVGLHGREVTTSELLRAIQKVVKPFGAKALLQRDPEVFKHRPHADFMVSGGFYTLKRTTPIEVVLHVGDPEKSIPMHTKNMNRLRRRVSSVLQHELIHKHQFSLNPEYWAQGYRVEFTRNLGEKRLGEIRYLSEMCEVDAYAHDIALELRYFYPNRKLSDLINSIDRLRNVPSFRFYTRAFRGVEWSSIRRALLMKVCKWYESAVPCAKLVM